MGTWALKPYKACNHQCRSKSRNAHPHWLFQTFVPARKSKESGVVLDVATGATGCSRKAQPAMNLCVRGISHQPRMEGMARLPRTDPTARFPPTLATCRASHEVSVCVFTPCRFPARLKQRLCPSWCPVLGDVLPGARGLARSGHLSTEGLQNSRVAYQHVRVLHIAEGARCVPHLERVCG